VLTKYLLVLATLTAWATADPATPQGSDEGPEKEGTGNDWNGAPSAHLPLMAHSLNPTQTVHASSTGPAVPAPLSNVGSGKDGKPNIVSIFTDDQDQMMDSLDYMQSVQNHLVRLALDL
jgi:hypothetical protein